MEFLPLVRTGTLAGTIEVDKAMRARGDITQLKVFEQKGSQSMVLAAALERKPADGQEGKPIRAVVVADIDLLSAAFFGIRNRPDDLALDFDNVTFVLNVLDSLAADDRFLDIRKRKPKHRTLERIEETVADAKEEADAQRQRFIDECDKAEKEANAGLEKEVGEFVRQLELRMRVVVLPHHERRGAELPHRRPSLAHRGLHAEHLPQRAEIACRHPGG